MLDKLYLEITLGYGKYHFNYHFRCFGSWCWLPQNRVKIEPEFWGTDAWCWKWGYFFLSKY